MQDLRLALRSLRATPAVTTVAVLSIALGIGANTAIFSLANSLLLRALPVIEPERLVAVRGGFPYNQSLNPGGMTYAVWDQIRQRAETFDGAIAWSVEERFNLTQAATRGRRTVSTSAATSFLPSACRLLSVARSRLPTMCSAAARMVP
jgi:hypothetical protein